MGTYLCRQELYRYSWPKNPRKCGALSLADFSRLGIPVSFFFFFPVCCSVAVHPLVSGRHVRGFDRARNN